MLALPPLLGGQIMIWWSAVFAKIITALISIVLTARNRQQIKIERKTMLQKKDNRAAGELEGAKAPLEIGLIAIKNA